MQVQKLRCVFEYQMLMSTVATGKPHQKHTIHTITMYIQSLYIHNKTAWRYMLLNNHTLEAVVSLFNVHNPEVTYEDYWNFIFIPGKLQ